MHVKTYTGSSTSAVLASIKADLGSNAVILDTRETVKDGRTEIAITAAQERENAVPSQNGSGGAAREAASSLTPSFSGMPGGLGGMGWKSWQEEWEAIKGHLLTLMKPGLQLSRLAPRQRVAIEFLEREGVDASTLLALFEALQHDAQASILTPLAGLVPVRGWDSRNWPQKVQLISGPFGAGKTTVLVRLALLLRKSAPGDTVWVVNADSRRGGGRLLLKNYAQLSGLEYKEAANAVEFARILASARIGKVDRILVDLPGLPRGKNMPDMLDYFGMTDPDNALHLVMTPHYGDAAMRELISRYAPAELGNAKSLIWTKLDEAVKFGAIITVGAASRMPVSALSCGPELSETLVPAESAALWRIVFKQEMPCAAHPDSSGF
ncbi:MAG: flagellar biosynthesis protein FlhF [Deltaproteobacteria bacterium]|jgi:flagellar biosynthesis protein FlhF|nr:flagellar biosynthesis protein FlhF [Deltaproteobacteria bacterium]